MGRGSGYVGGTQESIWLNRNGRGDIFKPGKVWCLAGRGGRRWGRGRGVGRASHKFTLSYHLIASIPAQALADRAKRSTEFLALGKHPFPSRFCVPRALRLAPPLWPELDVGLSIMRNKGRAASSPKILTSRGTRRDGKVYRIAEATPRSRVCNLAGYS